VVHKLTLALAMSALLIATTLSQAQQPSAAGHRPGAGLSRRMAQSDSCPCASKCRTLMHACVSDCGSTGGSGACQKACFDQFAICAHDCPSTAECP
jgi:hypothetical protein